MCTPGDDLAAAIAARVHPTRLTVYAHALNESELKAVLDLGVARVVVCSVLQIELLRANVAGRAQNLVVRMTDVSNPALAITDSSDPLPTAFRFDSTEADTAIAAILDNEWLDLVGLHCEVGSHDHDFVSYPAAIGQMIAEMTHIRRHHGVVLTRLCLGGARAIASCDLALELPQLAAQIDDALDDVCGTLRFPRPLVVLSTRLGTVGRNAA